jgi:hypothetical protein
VDPATTGPLVAMGAEKAVARTRVAAVGEPTAPTQTLRKGAMKTWVVEPIIIVGRWPLARECRSKAKKAEAHTTQEEEASLLLRNQVVSSLV